MKTRSGFVSNSSSTSFIIIGKSGNFGKFTDIRDNVIHITDGWEFGWNHETFNYTEARAAFAFLQAKHAHWKTYKFDSWDGDKYTDVKEYDYRDEWSGRVIKVIKEVTGMDVVFEHNLEDSYIDHASCSSDGENIHIFDDNETLKCFIFDNDSLIEMGNDNGYE